MPEFNIGPWTVAMQRRQTERVSVDTGEIGAPGTRIGIGGALGQEDYNADLQGVLAYDVFDRMRMADGQVRAGLQVIKLPLLRADWTVEPATEDAADVEIADFIEDALFNMTMTWQKFFRQVLLSLDYGSMPFEKVWSLEDGLYTIRKLAPRLPRTITQYFIDEHGGLTGIEQQVVTTTETKLATIPVEKLIIFVNDQEGANFRGMSVLRAAYKHWFFKDALYRIQAIAAERRAVGIDVGKMKGNTVDKKLRSEVEAALMRLRSHEKMYLTEIEDLFEYRIEGISGRTMDPQSAIDHHNVLILRSILAEFLAMGAGSDTGSRAMHTDKSSFFMMAEKAYAQDIADAMNEFLIKPWVDLNWIVDDYPKLVHSRLDTRDIQKIAEAVSVLLNSGGLTPTRETEDAVRNILELPELPEEVDVGKENPQLRAHKRRERQMARHKRRRRQYRIRGSPRAIEAAGRVNFRALEDGLDAAEQEIVSAVRSVQERQIVKLIAVGRDIFDSGAFQRIEKVVVPFRSEVASLVEDAFSRLFDIGRQQAAAEFAAGRPSQKFAHEPLDVGNERRVRAFLRARSRSLANLMADRLHSAFVWEMLAQVRVGEFDDGLLSQRLGSLSEREVRKTAAFSASESLNLGRLSVAEENKDVIENVIFTSVLDTGTCSPCETADGTELEVDTSEFEDLKPPYRECEGAGRCRCVYVFVLASEAPAQV